MTQMQNAQSVALQLEKVRDKLPLLYERDDILLTMIDTAVRGGRGRDGFDWVHFGAGLVYFAHARGVSHTGMREGRAVCVADHHGARRRAGSRGQPAVSVYDYGAADCRRFAAGSARSRNFYLRGRTAEQRGTGDGDGAARRLLPKIDCRRRHDVGARSLVPRNFRSAPARGNGAGGRARMGPRADAHGRLPGVRRKSEDWRGGLPALQRDLGRGESGEAWIRRRRGGGAIEREWRAVCRKEIAGLSAGKKKSRLESPPFRPSKYCAGDYSRRLSEFERRRENSASAPSPRARRVHCAGSGTLVAVPLVIMSGPSPPQPMQ
jgi:hypothetical protein